MGSACSQTRTRGVMRLLTIVALIFFGAWFAETMLEPAPLWATSVREAPKADARKKETRKAKMLLQQKQARPRETLPPNLGPGVGLGL